MEVCRKHGGGAPQNRKAAMRRLATLRDPALSAIERVLVNGKNEVAVAKVALEIEERTRPLEDHRPVYCFRVLAVKQTPNGFVVQYDEDKGGEDEEGNDFDLNTLVYLFSDDLKRRIAEEYASLLNGTSEDNDEGEGR
jgi:hypothetical protein